MVGGIAMAGMMSGLALVLANLSKQQHYIQKITETHFEVNSLFDIMKRNLYNKDACKQTLDGIIEDGRNITEIRNQDNGVIFDKVNKYGNRLIKIESMTLRNRQIASTGISGTVDLEVVVTKESKVIKGYNKVTRKLPIDVEVVPSSSVYNLVSCHHRVEDLDNMVDNAMNNQVDPLLDTKLFTVTKELCTVFGGTYVNSECVRSSSTP